MQEKYQSLQEEPGKHRERIGGDGDHWDVIGKLQFHFLKENGLEPQHTLLDLACGSLRLGIHVIPYLEKGNYFGIDMHEWLIRDGVEYELDQKLYEEKQPQFYTNETFDVGHFDVQFDYIMIQSLFTHLPLQKIEQCFMQLPVAMHDKTKCYFTFFPLTHPEQQVKIDEEPYHQPIHFYEHLAYKVGLQFEYIGEWNHPRGQHIAMFRL